MTVRKAVRESAPATVCTCNKATVGRCFCTDPWPIATQGPPFAAPPASQDAPEADDD